MLNYPDLKSLPYPNNAECLANINFASHWFEVPSFHIGVLHSIDLVTASDHSWWIYSATPLGIQTSDIKTGYPTQPYDPASELAIHILIMTNTRLSRNKYLFYKPFVWMNWDSNLGPSSRDACALPIQPPCPVPKVEIIYIAREE